jgi:hypothetical protein
MSRSGAGGRDSTGVASSSTSEYSLSAERLEDRLEGRSMSRIEVTELNDGWEASALMLSLEYEMRWMRRLLGPALDAISGLRSMLLYWP